MKIALIATLMSLSATASFAADFQCFKFQKKTTVVRLQIVSANPDVTTGVVALNEETDDMLRNLGKEGQVCLKGTQSAAGFLTYEGYGK